MSQTSNIDTEVNAPHQMRDIVLWGCSAVIATTAAITSYLVESDYGFPEIASVSDYSPGNKEANKLERDGEKLATSSIPDTDSDRLTTGSVPPTESSRSNREQSFGTTIVSRQSNADAVRRMGGTSPNSTSSRQETVVESTGDIGQGPIGIDLGTGHSFSVLGKRYTAMVNAAPTLFTSLTARASIVEHESSIEAHLVVGPLDDVQAAKKLCEKIRSRVNTPCTPANYKGRKLKLY